MRQKLDQINSTWLAAIITILIPLVLASCATNPLQKIYDIARPTNPWYRAYGFNSQEEVLTIASIPVLIDALGDQKPEVRVKVAESLTIIGADARDAVPALIEVISDDDYDVRVAVADALEEIALKLEPTLDDEIVETNLIKRLVNTVRLVSKDWMVKREAVNQLAELGEDAAEAVPDLIRVIEDRSDWHSRYNEILKGAATALGNIGPEAQPADPALIKMMENKDFDVRLEVVKALGKIGPKSDMAVIETLILALRGDPEFTEGRHAYARILPEKFKHLAYVGMFYGDPDFDIRREAAISLEKFEADAIFAVPALLDAVLMDIDFDVRHHSMLALCKIEPGGDSALIALDKALEDREGPINRETAVDELRHAPPEVREEWLPRIVACLDDIEEGVRFNAVRTLAEYNIGNEMVCKALNRVALEDKSLKVKKEAVKTLSVLKSDDSGSPTE